jgi:DNA-binding MarR family transcriptional regulator
LSSDTLQDSFDLVSRPLLGEAFARLRALTTEIDRLDQAAAECYGLSRTDMRCLEILGSAGPLAPTELARRLGYTTGGMTTVLDRLERAGYARRYADPHDRRRLLVTVTDATRARDLLVFGALVRNTMALLSGYSDADLAVIGSFLEQMRATTAAHTNALQPNASVAAGAGEIDSAE